jgi:hypothetical protein
MAVFTNHKVQPAQLFRIIPEELFSEIATGTQVDYYAKVLYGKVLFYLLLYVLLVDDKPGQRGIADLYASPRFRVLFNLQPGRKKISHGSLSERLSNVETDCFKKLYEIIYERYPVMYPAQAVGGLKLQRVDSSLVAEVSNRLKEGLNWGNGIKRVRCSNIQ